MTIYHMKWRWNQAQMKHTQNDSQLASLMNRTPTKCTKCLLDSNYTKL